MELVDRDIERYLYVSWHIRDLKIIHRGQQYPENPNAEPLSVYGDVAEWIANVVAVVINSRVVISALYWA